MMGVRLKTGFFWILLVAQSVSLNGLDIRLGSAQTEYSLAEGITLTISFHNDGEDALFLARPRSFGPGSNSLRIVARSRDCEYEVDFVHFDIHVDSLKFFFAPLLRGDTLSQPLPPVADASTALGLDLFLPGPGTYTFRLELSSEGELYEAFLGPIWRGKAQSNEIRLHLRPPSSAEVSTWRSKLAACLQAGTCMTDPAVRYFSHVKDEQAARLLVEVLRAEPNDSFAAEALFRQATPEAAEVLKATAAKSSVYAEVRQHYLSLAKKLERSDRRCPEVLSDDWH